MYVNPHTPAVTPWTNVINTVVGFVALKYQALGWGSPWAPVPTIFGPPCLSISLTLNSLLTIMIVVWLSLHIRNVRAAMGSPAGFGGLYSTIITMILESFALHAVASLLAIVSARTYPKSLLLNQPYAAIEDISYQILAQTQVRTFQWPRPSDKSSDMTTGWTGHRSAVHRSTSRQQECINGWRNRRREHKFTQL